MRYVLFLLTAFVFNLSYAEGLSYEGCLERKANVSLLITSYHWYEDAGFAIAEGEVKNVTGQKLDNVLAHVSFYTADNQLVTSSESFLDFTALMPGQRSTFTVYADINPLMQTAVVKFKTFVGTEVVSLWHETDCEQIAQ